MRDYVFLISWDKFTLNKLSLIRLSFIFSSVQIHFVGFQQNNTCNNMFVTNSLLHTWYSIIVREFFRQFAARKNVRFR